MPDTSFLTSTSIRRALRIDERSAPDDAVADPSTAAQRVVRWRDETGLGDDRHFAERLADAGLSEQSFCALLAEPSTAEPSMGANGDHPGSTQRPAWLERLENAYAAEPKHAMPEGELAQAHDPGLLAPARRLLDDTWCRMLDALSARAANAAGARLGDPTTLATLLAQTLPLNMLRMSNRASMLELHIARFEERLAGATPQARFAAYVEELETVAGAAGFFARYPVLARDLAVHCGQWIDTNLTMVDRLARDADLIARHFGDGTDLGPIIAIESGLSDRHNDGEGVAIITYEGGVSVVYKPRPLAVDRVFATLLDWLNQRTEGEIPQLTSPAAIDRGAYGWAERVVASACPDEAAVCRYYLRQGAFVALLYAIEATDFHHENVIACGEHPMMIDLETLFQPVAGSVRLAEGDSRPVAFNVLRNGLLPLRFSTDPNAQGFDVSGLGGLGNPKIGARTVVDIGMDTMSYAQTKLSMPQHRNRPRLLQPTDGGSDGEREVLVWERSDEVVAGFDAMIRLLIGHKEALLAADGPLAAFDGLELRFIARPTNLYVRLLEAMRHPDYQQDGLARDRLLDKLWLDTERFDHFRPLIPHERQALARFDVPRFRCRTDSLDLIADDGTPIEGYFEATPAELVRHRIAQLDDDDQTRQRWLVRASIAAIQPIDQRFRWRPRPLPVAGHPFEPARAREMAVQTGQRLAQLSQRISRDAVSWFQLAIAADDTWRLEPAGCDLYSGLSGIALFFAQLGVVADSTTGEAFRCLAEETLATSRNLQTSPTFAWPSIGGHNGLGGWLYTRAHLARLWHDEQQLDGCEEEVATLATLLAEDRGLDIIAGAAGAIAGLLALHEVTRSPTALATATACGEHLIAHAEQRTEGGIAWPAIDGSSQPLTGFAHGTAGFAWALARLTKATGDPRFADTARQALAYERSFFDPTAGSWPDLRAQRREQHHADGSRPFFYAWCHGAPGIGLSRLACLDLLDDREAMTTEIHAAVAATLTHGFGMNHGLCHGDLGNLEFIRHAAEQLDEPSWRQAGDDLAARILEDIAIHGRRSGIGPGIDQPGLMTGLAGIGYGLLRLAAPKRVPAVLTFELPPAPA